MDGVGREVTRCQHFRVTGFHIRTGLQANNDPARLSSQNQKSTKAVRSPRRMVGVVLRGDLSIRFRLKGQENALFKVFAVDGCVPKKLAKLCS